MFSGSRTRKALRSRSASRSLKRCTVARFHSRGRRSAVAGAGGPSSPGCALSSSASLLPVASRFKAAVQEVVDAAATLSTRDRNPLPSSAKPPRLSHDRRPSFIGWPPFRPEAIRRGRAIQPRAARVAYSSGMRLLEAALAAAVGLAAAPATAPPPSEGHHPPAGRYGNPTDLDSYVARLVDPARDAWQKPAEVVAALGLRAGDTACDIGA